MMAKPAVHVKSSELEQDTGAKVCLSAKSRMLSKILHETLSVEFLLWTGQELFCNLLHLLSVMHLGGCATAGALEDKMKGHLAICIDWVYVEVELDQFVQIKEVKIPVSINASIAIELKSDGLVYQGVWVRLFCDLAGEDARMEWLCKSGGRSCCSHRFFARAFEVELVIYELIIGFVLLEQSFLSREHALIL